jgi:DNA-binding PadR family transcriptional regulator
MKILKNPLQTFILKLIRDEPRNGYNIMKEIDKITGGWKPSCGSVYPILRGLKRNGLIKSESIGKKKIYNITVKGEEALTEFHNKYVTKPPIIIALNMMNYLIRKEHDIANNYNEKIIMKQKILHKMIEVFKIFMSVYEVDLSKKHFLEINRIMDSLKNDLENIRLTIKEGNKIE